MKILPISLPRSRSTFLFESLQGYQEHLGLLVPSNHSEYFLEYNRNVEFFDSKTGNYVATEIFPVVFNDRISMQFMYPHLFKDSQSRNEYKLKLLREEKDKGREYYIKSTSQISDNIKEIIDFFSDRTVLLTKRQNMIDNVLSAQFAWETKLFHCRENNLDLYMKHVNDGISLDVSRFHFYINYVLNSFYKVENYLKENDIKYEILYYEYLTDDDYISEAIGTDEWVKYRKPEHILTKHIEKDYSKIILNYDECVSAIKDLLNAN